MITNISKATNATPSKNKPVQAEQNQAQKKKKTWAEIKAEAKAEVAANKKKQQVEKTDVATHKPAEVKKENKNSDRPSDAMNVQASQEETAKEGDFEEQIQDDITLVDLNPQNFLPLRSRLVNMQRNGNFAMARHGNFALARHGKFSHADNTDEIETEQAPNHEPAPYGEGSMPNNVGSLTTHKDPKKEFDKPVSVYGEPQEHYKIHNKPDANSMDEDDDEPSTTRP